MTSNISTPAADWTEAALPDHTQLPDTDGEIVENFQELPQTMLLSDAIKPILEQRHPDGQYALGGNSGIYWWATNPPLEGCRAPDWYYIPDVPPLEIDGVNRRSYVIWKELELPFIVMEFVSGDGSAERDRTPRKGKFWVYEHGMHAQYYAIYDCARRLIEVYRLVHQRYQQLAANERGHYPIEPLGVELGLWQGVFQGMDLPWLRWWDAEGRLLLIGQEIAEQANQRAEQANQRAEQANQRAEQANQRAEQAEQRAARLAEKLRALGIEPNGA